eukprot:366367-Chlamydomonas_euryale.AAC.2
MPCTPGPFLPSPHQPPVSSSRMASWSPSLPLCLPPSFPACLPPSQLAAHLHTSTPAAQSRAAASCCAHRVPPSASTPAPEPSAKPGRQGWRSTWGR